MSKGYDEWFLNHSHPVGQDGFKDDIELEIEERIAKNKEDGCKKDELYLQSHPFCKALFYCNFCKNTFTARASEKHYCECGSVTLARRIKLIKPNGNYGSIRE